MSTTNKLINILKKEDRSVDDIQFLKAYLSKIKFFQQVFDSFKASPEISNDICRAVKYETYPKYQIIFKQGDKSCDKAYIILKGRTIVLMQNTIDVFQKETDQEQNCVSDIASVSQVELLLENCMLEQDDIVRNNIPDKDYQAVLCKQYGKIIMEIEEGALFGEKALIENKPRAATICTKTPSEFLILYKLDFEVVQSKYNKLQNDKREFILAKFPILGNLITSARVFERIVRFFDEETYHKNQILVKEGQLISQDNQKIYIVVQGEVQLYKNVEKQVHNTHSLIQVKVEQIHVATLSNKEMFGEEFLDSDVSKSCYQYTAVCVSSNSQFLTISTNIIEKKLPDQIKEQILSNYQIKKCLRNNITKEQETQQRQADKKLLNDKSDQYEVEKNLLTKIQSIKKQKEQQYAIKNKQEQQQIFHSKEIPIIDNQIGKISEFLFRDLNEDQNCFLEMDDHLSLQEILNDCSFQGQIKCSQDQQLFKSQINLSKSLDSTSDLQHNYNDRLQVIKGNSDQQNIILFHQLKSDLYEKIKDEGGFKKDMNLSYFYDHGLKEDQYAQQLISQKCNPYPFKLTANHKHLKQLETRLKQKKFQFADAQEILSNTKYYQAIQKNDLSLKNMVEESQNKIKKLEEKKDNSSQLEKLTLDGSKKNLFSIKNKSSNPKPSNQEKDIIKQENDMNEQFIVKDVGITNLFKEKIKISDSNSRNSPRDLFAYSDKIKLHSILKKIQQNCRPHNDYFTNYEDSLQQIANSKQNSEFFYKYYEMSNRNKASPETRKVLSRSPILRRINFTKQSAINGGGVSIPSNKRFIVDNDHNVNENYYYYKTSCRPSSEEARVNEKSNYNKPQKQNQTNNFECMLMQSSLNEVKQLSKINKNKTNNIIISSQQISVKYMSPKFQTEEQLESQKFSKQLDSFSIQNSQIDNRMQRLHSSKNSPQNQSIIKGFSTNYAHNKISLQKKQSNLQYQDFSFQEKSIDHNNQQNSLNSSIKSKNSIIRKQSGSKEHKPSAFSKQDQTQNNTEPTNKKSIKLTQSITTEQNQDQPLLNHLKEDQKIVKEEVQKISNDEKQEKKSSLLIKTISQENSNNIELIKSQNSKDLNNNLENSTDFRIIKNSNIEKDVRQNEIINTINSLLSSQNKSLNKLKQNIQEDNSETNKINPKQNSHSQNILEQKSQNLFDEITSLNELEKTDNNTVTTQLQDKINNNQIEQDNKVMNDFNQIDDDTPILLEQQQNDQIYAIE